MNSTVNGWVLTNRKIWRGLFILPISSFDSFVPVSVSDSRALKCTSLLVDLSVPPWNSVTFLLHWFLPPFPYFLGHSVTSKLSCSLFWVVHPCDCDKVSLSVANNLSSGLVLWVPTKWTATGFQCSVSPFWGGGGPFSQAGT